MNEASTKLDQMRAEIRERVAQLRTERDTLLVRVHLAKTEGREEWAKVEAKWENFQAKAHTVGATAAEASGDVLASLKLLGEEIRDAYRRIKAAI